MRIALLVFVALFLSYGTCLAAPGKPAVTVAGGFANISGASFGIKSTAAPAFWSNFDSDTTGQLPTGVTNPNTTYGGLVEESVKRGAKSVSFHFDTEAAEQWSRDAIDLGVGGVDTLYISTWMYMDRTGTTSTDWQIKSIVFGAPPYGYFGDGGDNATVGGLQTWWYETESRWFNPFAHLYYNGMANSGADAGNLASDAFPWNSWYRLEIYAKRSTTNGAADGIWYINRVGKSTPLGNVTTAVTHDGGEDLKWRIVGFGQGVASNYSGRLKLDVHYDDVYIDSTPARVEMCDSATWANRTHCEIQPPTAWAAEAITATYNPGSFVTGQTAYFYVIDSTGAVSPASDGVVLGGASDDVTAPVTTIPLSRIASKTSVTLTCTDNVACTATTYCTASTTCTPGTTYTAPFTVYPGQYVCANSTDGTNTEATHCARYGWPTKCN